MIETKRWPACRVWLGGPNAEESCNPTIAKFVPVCKLTNRPIWDELPSGCPLKTASAIEHLAAIQDRSFYLLYEGARWGDASMCQAGRLLNMRFEVCLGCLDRPEIVTLLPRDARNLATKTVVSTARVARSALGALENQGASEISISSRCAGNGAQVPHKPHRTHKNQGASEISISSRRVGKGAR